VAVVAGLGMASSRRCRYCDCCCNVISYTLVLHIYSLHVIGFARCPDICPSEMLKVGKVMDSLATDYPELAKKVVPVFVSVDPARDSLKGTLRRVVMMREGRFLALSQNWNHDAYLTCSLLNYNAVALREYGKDFHPSYIFLTGSPEQVQQMAKKYRVYVSKADETEDGDYLVDHSIVIYFHDETGELADCFTQSMRPTDVVEKIIERMEEAKRVKQELAA